MFQIYKKKLRNLKLEYTKAEFYCAKKKKNIFKKILIKKNLKINLL